MNIETKIISLVVPPLGKLIDTLDQQPAEIREHLRQLHDARAAGVPFHTPHIKAIAAAVMRYYVERGLNQAGLDASVFVVPDGFVDHMLRHPKDFPPEVQTRLQALLDAGADPNLQWDDLSDAAKAAIEEHAPFLKKFWEEHHAIPQHPDKDDSSTSFSA